MSNYFLKFSRDIINSKNFTALDIFVLALLGRYRTIEGWVYTSIKYLVVEAGYKPDSHKGKINYKVKETLQKFSDNMFIDFDDEVDISKLRVNDMFRVYILDDDVFDSRGYFTMLYFDDLDCILHTDINVDKPLLLYGFLAIKQFISGAPNAPSAINIAYPAISTIRSIIGVSSNDTVMRTLNGLCEIGLLYMKNCGSYLKNGKYRNCPNCYALEEKHLEDADYLMKAELGVSEFYPLKTPHNSKEKETTLSNIESNYNNNIIDDNSIIYSLELMQDEDYYRHTYVDLLIS